MSSVTVGFGMCALLGLSLAVCAPAQAVEQEVSFAGAGGFMINGTLTVPDSAGGKKSPALLLIPGPGHAVPQASHVHASLYAEADGVQEQTPFLVAVHLKMDPGWHTYWKDPGDSGLATSIEWKLPSGFVADPIRWPKPMVISSELVVVSMRKYSFEPSFATKMPLTLLASAKVVTPAGVIVRRSTAVP